MGQDSHIHQYPQFQASNVAPVSRIGGYHVSIGVAFHQQLLLGLKVLLNGLSSKLYPSQELVVVSPPLVEWYSDPLILGHLLLHQVHTPRVEEGSDQ